MTAAERQQIDAADERRRRAECAELEMRIRLCIMREKIAGLESAEHKRQRTLIQSAVEKLVATGAVHVGDHLGQFRVLEQLARDPSLVTLALTKKIFRARPTKGGACEL